MFGCSETVSASQGKRSGSTPQEGCVQVAPADKRLVKCFVVCYMQQDLCNNLMSALIGKNRRTFCNQKPLNVAARAVHATSIPVRRRVGALVVVHMKPVTRAHNQMRSADLLRRPGNVP